MTRCRHRLIRRRASPCEKRYCLWCESLFIAETAENSSPLCEACRSKLMAKGKRELLDLIEYIAGYNAVASTYLHEIRDLTWMSVDQLICISIPL